MQPHIAPSIAFAAAVLTSAIASAQVSKPPASTSPSSAPAPATKPAVADNGTDPTKVIRTAAVQYQYLGLPGGFDNGILRLTYTMPLGASRSYSLRLRAPVTSLNVVGDSSYGLGDASVMVGHVFGLTRAHGFVLQGEMIFDTASRPELGAGKTVAKGSFIYAKFFKHGIFAPAFVQNNSVAGDKARATVNTTTMDFYYVPRLKDPKNFMTFDPAINVDWEHSREFVSLALTMGRVLGPALGGTSQLFVKPSVFGGTERAANWGIEVGYKVLGF